jgi:hypothetical protein
MKAFPLAKPENSEFFFFPSFLFPCLALTVHPIFKVGGKAVEPGRIDSDRAWRSAAIIPVTSTGAGASPPRWTQPDFRLVGQIPLEKPRRPPFFGLRLGPRGRLAKQMQQAEPF